VLNRKTYLSGRIDKFVGCMVPGGPTTASTGPIAREAGRRPDLPADPGRLPLKIPPRGLSPRHDHGVADDFNESINLHGASVA